MDFWRWLTSTEGLPVLVAIIGVIGTIVAVAATVITQIVTNRSAAASEKSRFDWERQRYAADMRAAEKSRFEDIKREAFAKLLFTADRLHQDLLFIDRCPYPIKFLLASLYSVRVKKYADMFVETKYQILLVAPELDAVVDQLIFKTHGRVVYFRRRYVGDPVKDFERALEEARSAMQGTLAIETEREAHNQPQLNEASMSGKSKSTKPGDSAT